ncbi:MAG TPA: DUF4998 domain-containing protein, partial [Sphingobacterium sp.]|nr:DUF4998 domain-containing protein [Sphingobacterium sp.]
VQKTTGSDTVRVLLQNLIEGIQYFDIYMYDKLGHSSVKSSVPSMIYGPVYQSSLLSRTYRNIKRVGNNIEINWVPAGDDMVRTEVRYTNTSNNPVEHVISGRSNQSILENVPVLGEITYRTAFLPDSTALDVIYTPFTRINPL